MTITLSPQRIATFCQGPAQQIALQAVEETGSTNADLLAAIDRLNAPTLLVAERQTAGRGRAGRAWHSQAGASLTFSLAWKFALPVHALVGLPLAIGVAIADALAMFDVKVQLKWPNDVLHEGRKLAGILIETAAVAPREGSWAVIGVGLNMAVDAALAATIGRPVADIPWLTELDRDMLMATLLNKLADTLVQFEQTGFAGFAPRWNALHAYSGQTVMILDNGRVLHEGVAAGVDATGRLMLDTAAGPVAVMAGDVSLRVAGG
ncbi:biotin--[acetyl-CoA-carboxylase] ligase [Noviherbaspirillum cavernae]|uniref:biotin--[biotin carboxyl-carrier protein] ligase n=1 Tax=Noviherbaspirillum cavernae TaxID=2320862 RepID=A0A418WXF4_9BURK|nr:biotin--[acetyl-CoA-carboxylase] ligase [Noviherbaspirillum cavernae]RJG04877.1 biotin--[acetyl-CoA-carboxylase] ligase [Noviherbaspirillum cavernae]